ncbi:MAG: molecular chaperone HtpG [Oscillospiraceae bacterium]|nr:molecular chaperone HtpG [Oscillospiraceae bacterium]
MAKKQFKAESKRLLDLMINSIYTNKEIFLREIISNASDAIDKLCYLSLTDDKVGLEREDYRIRITVDKDERTITVSDNGIGMTQDEAEKNLGVIAKSGSYKFKSEMDSDEAEKDDISIIGQFGVGFYSAFMVSDKVTVITRKYGEEKGVRWESTGADGYTVAECDKYNAGTDVIMHIKEDTDEEIYGSYLEIWKLKMLVKKYSDYVRWPIVMDITHQEQQPTGEEDKDGNPKMQTVNVTAPETVNSMVPIWQRSKAEVTDEQCVEWYKETMRDQTDPAVTLRVNAEGTVSYKAMLFVPGKDIDNGMSGATKRSLKLYCNGVLIMENCDKLLHEYFEFVRGVVDSPDLSLNISREVLQHNRQLKVIGQNLEKKIKGELEKMMKDDRPKYETFWKNFGIHIKCGVCDEYGRYTEFLKDLLIFYTSEESQMTLKEYSDNMPESQKAIYYASADTVKHAMSMPQCEEVRSRGYDILYLDHPIDETVLMQLKMFEGKPFVNVLTEDLGFQTDEEKKAAEEKTTENKELLDFVRESVGDEKLKQVTLSSKLVSSSCCLTSSGPFTLEMEKYFRNGPSEEMRQMRADRVLELNANHRAFAAIRDAYDAGDKDRAADMSKILYAQAELIAGLEVEDATAYAELVCKLF